MTRNQKPPARNPSQPLSDRTFIQKVNDKIDEVYAQRNSLAIAFVKAALAAGWTAGRGIDPAAEDPEWSHVVYVDVPGLGQVSWHMAPDAVPLLTGLPQYAGKWDGSFRARNAEWCRFSVTAMDLLRAADYGHTSRRRLVERSIYAFGQACASGKVQIGESFTKLPEFRDLMNLIIGTAPWAGFGAGAPTLEDVRRDFHEMAEAYAIRAHHGHDTRLTRDTGITAEADAMSFSMAQNPVGKPVCTMNCGPVDGDTRTRAERQVDCDDCIMEYSCDGRTKDDSDQDFVVPEGYVLISEPALRGLIEPELMAHLKATAVYPVPDAPAAHPRSIQTIRMHNGQDIRLTRDSGFDETHVIWNDAADKGDKHDC